MKFPYHSRVFVGQGLLTKNIVLVITDDPGTFQRECVFLSKDGGENYQELFVGGYSGTRLDHIVTLVVPSGAEMYVGRYNYTDESIAFPDFDHSHSGGVYSAVLLRLQKTLPAPNYSVDMLTETQLDMIRKLEQ